MKYLQIYIAIEEFELGWYYSVYGSHMNNYDEPYGYLLVNIGYKLMVQIILWVFRSFVKFWHDGIIIWIEPEEWNENGCKRLWLVFGPIVIAQGNNSIRFRITLLVLNRVNFQHGMHRVASSHIVVLRLRKKIINESYE